GWTVPAGISSKYFIINIIDPSVNIAIRKNISRKPNTFVMTNPIRRLRTREERITMKIYNRALARLLDIVIRDVIVNASTIISAALAAVKTRAIITNSNVGLKYVNILPKKKINKVIKNSFFLSIFAVNDNKMGPAIAKT